MDKKIKDPIYGYVKIPVEYMEEIIDKAELQRLRRILQTSYSPLYSSAIHNRFVHSIGVFHLGSMAAADTTKDNMFYIFYRRKNHNHIKDKKEFCKSLVVKTIDM